MLADTKFEFGSTDEELILFDEALTPDSSRYWRADSYEAGPGCRRSTSSTCATGSTRAAGTTSRRRRSSPRTVVEQTAARYREAYERITGEGFDAYLARMGAAEA